LAISASSFQLNSPNIGYNGRYDYRNLRSKSDIPKIPTSIASPLPVYTLSPERRYDYRNLRNKLYRLIHKGESDIQKIPTSIASPLPVYLLSPERRYELLTEGAVYENIYLIENLPLEDLEEEVEISEELKEFENDMLKDNIILNEEESELFLQELKSLHYSDETLEFYKSSTQILKKIKNGEFIIDI